MNRALVLGCVLACSAFAQKGDAVSEVDTLYGEGEFERAIKKADVGIARSKSANEAARLQLAKGLSLLAIGKADKARAAFVAGLKKDATVRLEAARVSPEALELFTRALAEFPATVTISVSNGGGSVRVDGQAMGPAPLTTQVTAGAHVFEVTAGDGRTARVEETIEAGARTPVLLTLPAPTVAPQQVADATPAPLVESEPEAPATTPPVDVIKPAAKRSLVGLVPLIGGALVTGAGVFSFIGASTTHRQLTDPFINVQFSDGERIANDGKIYQALGWVGTTVGGVAMATGIVLLALPPSDDSKPTVSAFMTPGGGMVSVQGRLP